MFTEDELHQARAVPVLEIAERHGARLKRSGHELVGACPVCGGVDRFALLPAKNIWNCRGYGGGDAIALEMHLGGGSFVDAVRTLIGKDAGTSRRRQPTAEEIAARKAREDQRRREEAEEAARNASSAAKILARLQPVVSTPGETYLRDARRIDVSHRAIRRALEDVETLGCCERVYFKQEDPNKPFHELHGQYLGAIVAILTDPVSGERTGGITRTFIHEGRKIGKAMSLGGVGRLGIIRLSPDAEVLAGLHLCEGIESALSAMQMNFCPMWAAGSTATMAKFPVLHGIECFTAVADNDVVEAAGREAGQQAAREVCQRWADAGRKAVMKIPKRPGEDANDIIRRGLGA
jgi:phage/plasmid primase-like uncharacterized protein